MEEIVKHWQVIVSVAALLVYAARVEVEVRHLKRDMAVAEERHIRCLKAREERESSVAATLTSIQIMVARIDQRLSDLINGGGSKPQER